MNRICHMEAEFILFSSFLEVINVYECPSNIYDMFQNLQNDSTFSISWAYKKNTINVNVKKYLHNTHMVCNYIIDVYEIKNSTNKSCNIL